jgi:hypothetical protein
MNMNSGITPFVLVDRDTVIVHPNIRNAMIQGKVEDDRAPSSAEFYQRLNALAGEILERHADKAPRHYTIADSRNWAAKAIDASCEAGL